jgi:hypothetical protein
MSERSEFRSRREERTENGVKNPIGSEAISQEVFPKSFPLVKRNKYAIILKNEK